VRLFIAVNIPAEERNAIYQATEPLRAAGFPLKHSEPETLHLTLKFLGQVRSDVADAVGFSLKEAVRGVKAFDLGLGGFGAFPDLSQPSVVWLGVEKHPALELLANDVERAVSRHGFQPELRPFAPHVTIARAQKDAKPSGFQGLEAAVQQLSHETVIPVASIDLMESLPGKGGTTYRLKHRALLAGD
jgi:2'-5' RNA ligase